MKLAFGLVVLWAANLLAAAPDAKIATLNNENWDREVLESEKPVLVVFVGTLSRESDEMAPVVKELAGEFDGRVKFGRLNIDQNEKLADKHRITFTPAFVLFKFGKPTKLGSRILPKAELAAKINEALK